MKTRLPSIDALLAFEAAARLLSFEKCAEELSITPSAVSKRITALEDLLGAKLFSRSSKAISLTVAGKEYLYQVRDVLAQLSSIVLHQRDAQAAQRLRIVAPPTFSRQVLIPHLAQFIGHWPDLDIEVVVATPFLETATPEADVEVQFGVAPSHEQRLLFEPVFAMASPSYLQSIAALKTPADLAHATLLRCPPEPWTPWLRAAGLDWGEPSGRLAGPKLVDMGLTAEAAASGQGIALGRASLAAQWLAAGRLERVFATITIEPLQGYWLKQTKSSPQALAFSQWLIDVCATLEKTSRQS